MFRDIQLSVSWKSNGMTFMQDSAPIHTARKVKKRLENHDIQTIDWSFYSPDLTVIEHIWVKLKKMIYQMCLNIEEMDGSKKKIKDVLLDALKKAWKVSWWIDSEYEKKSSGCYCCERMICSILKCPKKPYVELLRSLFSSCSYVMHYTLLRCARLKFFICSHRAISLGSQLSSVKNQSFITPKNSTFFVTVVSVDSRNRLRFSLL